MSSAESQELAAQAASAAPAAPAPAKESRARGAAAASAEPAVVPKSANLVIRAIDLGWGYTKFSYMPKGASELAYMAIPSLAPRASNLDLSSSILGQRNTRIVTVDGVSYEVGVDSGDLDNSDAARSLNSNFIHTEQYRAVFYGALAYIDEPVIDTLVVGLPLNNMNLAAKLRSSMEGTHKVNDQLTCVVKEALVVPQPLGGLHYCLSLAKPDTPFEFMPEECNLLIDPGYLTFDFLFTNGTTVVENRSYAYPGGVSKVLMALAQSISQKHSINYDNLTAIDRGLRRRRIKINGVEEQLAEHIRNTKDVLEATVNFMRNRVGDGSDVENIILMGGGGALFQKTIEQFYPKHKLIIVPDGQLANVRGFQLAGEMHAKKR